MKIPVLITARLSSTRLPRKHLLKLGNLTVIEHVINRCKHFGFWPILCIPLEVWPNLDCDIFEGDMDQFIRIKEAAKKFELEKFHHLDGDDPYFDPLEIKRSFSYLKDDIGLVKPTGSSSLWALGMMGSSYGPGSKKIFLPEQKREMRHNIIRLTLDYEEDYWFLASMVRAGADYTKSREEVEKIASYPLANINLFHNKQWKERQLVESGCSI